MVATRALFTLLILAAGARAGTLPPLAPPETGRRAPQDAAVVVGIARYDHLPAARFADDDAAAFQRFLLSTIGVPAERISNLHASPPVREDILEELRRRAGQVGPSGTLWIYFSGHGSPGPDGDALLLGADVRATERSLRTRGLRRSEVISAAQRSRAGRAVILLDACFSGRGRGGEALTDLKFIVPATVASVPRVVVWTAAGESELAGPLVEAGHGLFTYFAIGGLSGWADDDGDGRVRGEELSRYVTRGTRAALSSGARTQSPEWVGPAESGRWVLAEAVSGRGGPDLQALSVGAGGGAPGAPATVESRQRIEPLPPLRPWTGSVVPTLSLVGKDFEHYTFINVLVDFQYFPWELANGMRVLTGLDAGIGLCADTDYGRTGCNYPTWMERTSDMEVEIYFHLMGSVGVDLRGVSRLPHVQLFGLVGLNTLSPGGGAGLKLGFLDDLLWLKVAFVGSSSPVGPSYADKSDDPPEGVKYNALHFGLGVGF